MDSILSVAAQLLGFAAAAGVVSGLLTHYLSVRKDAKSKHLANAYTAIRLAVIFEEFAGECADLIFQNGNAESSGGAAGEPETNLPTLADLPPDDEGWRGLSAESAAEALSFRLRLRWAQEAIQNTYAFAEPEDAVREATDQAVLLGASAWELAEGLRRKHGFKSLKPEFQFQKAFLDRLPDVRKRRIAFGASV